MRVCVCAHVYVLYVWVYDLLSPDTQAWLMRLEIGSSQLVTSVPVVISCLRETVSGMMFFFESKNGMLVLSSLKSLMFISKAVDVPMPLSQGELGVPPRWAHLTSLLHLLTRWDSQLQHVAMALRRYGCQAFNAL